MSAAKQPAPVAYRPGPDLAGWLEDRAERALSTAGLGARTRTELFLWRAVLQAELDIQRWTLTELAALAAALNGSMISDAVPTSIGHCAVELTDARRGREDDWDADIAAQHAPGLGGNARWSGDALLAKLARLGPAADMALSDAISRWLTGKHEHSVEGWAQVGVRAVTNHPSVRHLAGSLHHDGPPVTVEEMDAVPGEEDDA